MNYFAYFMLAAVFLGIVLLAVPFSLGYDSADNRLQVKWLGLTITKRRAAAKPPKSGKIAPKKRRIPFPALMAHLWHQRDLLVELSSQAGRFVLRVLRTLSFRESEATVSLPDPMWNGVLYGLLANIHLEEVDLSVNFEQRNYAKIWVTVYPHRVARQLAALLIRLPYLNLVRFAWDLRKQAERG